MSEEKKRRWLEPDWTWRDDPPRTDYALAGIHARLADGMRRQAVYFLDAVVPLFGEATAEAMALAFLANTGNPSAPEKARESGWRDVANNEDWTDWINMSQRLLDCLRYGIEGIAPRESERETREKRVQNLNEDASALLDRATPLLPDEALWAVHFALARFAFDFGKKFTLQDLQLLAQIGYAAVRNAAAAGEFRVAHDGTVDHRQGSRWLARRREFLPSRWRDQADDQQPIVAGFVRDSDSTQVPRCEDGLFLPETSVRRNRASGGIHVTIGTKGEEESVSDFFEALGKLANMPTPRWRRRNGAGNWGIVRARGAWVSVPTELIKEQLAAFSAHN